VPGNPRRSNQVTGRLQEAKNCSQRLTVGIVLVSSSATAGEFRVALTFLQTSSGTPLRCWNSASVIVPADVGIQLGPISDAPSSRTGYPV
jgi:hypothetical protein